MTREEAIKLLECSATELVGTMMQTNEQTAVNQLRRYVDAYDMAIAALREQDSNANQHVSNTSNALGGWISVKERLPGDEKPVLVYYGFWRKENAGTALRYTGTLSYFRFDPQPHWQHESTGLIVTHWMPLPEPPKEEV